MAAVIAECVSNAYNAAVVPSAERLTCMHVPPGTVAEDGSTRGKIVQQMQHTPAQGPKAELRNDVA